MKKKKKIDGRPTKYLPKYCKEIIEYFSIPYFEDKVVARVTGKNDYKREETKEIANPIRFLSGFARSIGVVHETLHVWSKKYPIFLVALKQAKQLQKEMLIVNGLKGLYQPAAFCFTMKNITGMDESVKWRDTHDIDHGDRINSAAASISALFRQRYEKEAPRLAAGEDPSMVLFGRARGHAENGKAASRN